MDFVGWDKKKSKHVNRGKCESDRHSHGLCGRARYSSVCVCDRFFFIISVRKKERVCSELI